MQVNSIKRIITLVILCFGVILSAKYFYDSSRLNFDPEDAEFSIRFPGPPERIPSENIHAFKYYTNEKKFYYMVAYWNATKVNINNETKAQLIASVVSKELERYPIVLKDEETIFEGEMARDVLMKAENGNTMKAKIILKKNLRMIMVVVFVKKTEDLNDSSVNAYFNSLKLQ